MKRQIEQMMENKITRSQSFDWVDGIRKRITITEFQMHELIRTGELVLNQYILTMDNEKGQYNIEEKQSEAGHDE